MIRHLRTPKTTWRSGNATTRVRIGRPLTFSLYPFRVHPRQPALSRTSACSCLSSIFALLSRHLYPSPPFYMAGGIVTRSRLHVRLPDSAHMLALSLSHSHTCTLTLSHACLRACSATHARARYLSLSSSCVPALSAAVTISTAGGAVARVLSSPRALSLSHACLGSRPLPNWRSHT